MNPHIWVEIKYTPVVVEEEPDGSLHVSATDLSIETANEDAHFGCWICLIGLTTETFHTECSGESPLTTPQ